MVEGGSELFASPLQLEAMKILLDIRHPLVISLAGLISGVVIAGSYFIAVPLWLPFVIASVLAISIYSKKVVTYLVVLFLFWFTWGAAGIQIRLYQAKSADVLLFCDIGVVTVEGRIAGRTEILAEGERFELDSVAVITEKGRALTDGRILATVGAGRTGLNRGDILRFSAPLRTPRKLGLPGEFNYPRYLALQGISATVWLKEPGDLVLMRPASLSSLRQLIDRQSERCRIFIRSVLPDPDVGPVMAALVTGGQREIPTSLSAAYSRSGVSHILSISGFHLGVISFVIVKAISWLLLRSERISLYIVPRRLALFLSLPFVIYYLMFTGAAPATVRAAVMLGAVALALWAERKDAILHALLTAAFVMLLVDPAALFDVSFQFSFLALWGIIILTPLLLSPFEGRISGFFYTVAQLLAASTAASLTTAIPALVVFHQASFTGILANLLIVPILGYGATVLGALSIPLMLTFTELAKPLLLFAGLLVQLSNSIVQQMASLPVARSFSFGGPDLIALVVVLTLLSVAIARKLRTAALFAAVVLIASIKLWPVSGTDGKLRLTLLSVGQAESVLINLPDGRTMLVDGGGYLQDNGRDFGERYLVPALHAMKVRRIDFMVLSHPHPDHLGGLPVVAEQFPVGEFWQGPWEGNGADYNRLLSALQKRKASLRTLVAGDTPLKTDSLEIRALWPTSRERVSVDGDNEDSLVLRIAFGKFSALLTGDAGLPLEEWLLKNGTEKITLLKVGHHGSRTASSELFLEQIQPDIALISVGAGNRFGLPAPDVLKRLQRHGARIYRTDQDGTVQVETDGKGHSVITGVTGG